MKSIFTLFIVFLSSVPTIIGQTIELGSGTSESSNYDASPVNIYYRRTIAQFVYTAAELNAAGASTTTPISEVGFYVTEAPLFDLPNYRIRVKHTTQSDVSTAIAGGGWTNLVNGITYAPTAGGWDMHTSSGSFIWDGVSNIAFEVCWSRVSPSWWPSGKVRVEPTTNGFRYSVSDSPGTSCGATPGTTSSNRPQVKLVFIPGDTTFWTGSSNTMWNVSSNWTTGVPSSTMNAVIPGGLTNMPYVGSGTVNTRYLRIESGATLTLDPSSILEVYGDLQNDGSLITNESTVSLYGSEPTDFRSLSQNFYNLSIQNPYGVTMSGSPITITNELILEGGDFTTNDLIILESDANGTARIPEIKTACAYTLDMTDAFGDGWNGGYIDVQVNGISQGKFSASGSNTIETFYAKLGEAIDIIYVAGTYEDENSYDVLDPDGNVIFSDGVNPSTGTVFSTTSSCTFSNPLIGTVEVRRYIDAGATDWRFLTSPVQGADLEQFDDDFITSGFPGTDYPNWPTAANPWPSFYFYSESLGTTFDDGYYVPSSTSEVIATGQGIWIWCGDNSAGTQPFTIDFFGSINAGTINLPVSLDVASGNPEYDGWNMVANPYPGTIDWDSPNWTKTNIEDAIYIWNPDIQQYATYIAGVGTNSGNNLIASSQAFMVHADASNPELIVQESCKANEDAPFIKASWSADLLRLKVKRGAYSDETVIRFDNNASNGFDRNADARKPFFGASPAPAIYTQIGGLEYSVNTLNEIQGAFSIPVHFKAASNGTHILEFMDMSAIENMSCVILEDKLTGAYINVKIDSSYSFQASTSHSPNRFVLHLVNNTTINVSDASCAGLNDGTIELQGVLPMHGGSLTGPNLQSPISYAGNDTIASNLVPGQYQIQITYPFYGCNSVQNVTIQAPQVIDTYENILSPTCSTCEDGSIQLDISGGTAPYSVMWKGMTATDTLPEVFNVNTGTYWYSVVDNNGCTLNQSVDLNSILSTGTDYETGFTVYPNPANSQVSLSGLNPESIVLIYSSSGQLMQQLMNGQQYQIETSDWPAGVYLISIDNSVTRLVISH